MYGCVRACVRTCVWTCVRACVRARAHSHPSEKDTARSVFKLSIVALGWNASLHPEIFSCVQNSEKIVILAAANLNLDQS